VQFKLVAGQGISGRVISEGKAIIVADSNDEHFKADINEEDPFGVLFAPPSILSVPLMVKGRVAGALTISGGCNGRPFNDDHLEFLTMLSRYASIAVENAGIVYNLKKQR
jgi:GAF domain-containing protein